MIRKFWPELVVLTVGLLFLGVARADLPRPAAEVPKTKSTMSFAASSAVCTAAGCGAVQSSAAFHAEHSSARTTVAGRFVTAVRGREFRPVRNLVGRFLPFRKRCG